MAELTRVAFLTYNTVGHGIASGWHDADGRRALVVQDTEGLVDHLEDVVGPRGRREVIGTLWKELQKVLPDLDHVVVYVGVHGSEPAIELAAQLSATKVTFVCCFCDLSIKEEIIRQAGLAGAGMLPCECGGEMTMGLLFTQFLATGHLLPTLRVPA